MIVSQTQEMELPRPRRSASDIVWSALPPGEHLVQLYTDDQALLGLLEAFVAGGLATGESVVLVATREHVDAVDARLRDRDLAIEAARERGHYLTVDASVARDAILVQGWPDAGRVRAMAAELLAKARRGGRPVRVFGEIVALLWRDGHGAAALELERIWHVLCHEEQFSLLCAYPHDDFGPGEAEAVHAIRAAHSRVLACEGAIAQAG